MVTTTTADGVLICSEYNNNEEHFTNVHTFVGGMVNLNLVNNCSVHKRWVEWSEKAMEVSEQPQNVRVDLQAIY